MANYVTPVNRFLKSIDPQPYDRYLPNAFNDSLSLLEKVNKVIYQLNQSTTLSNEIVQKWNGFVDWVNEGGLQENIHASVNDLLTDDTLINLIDNELMVDFKTEIKTDTSQKLSVVNQKITDILSQLDQKADEDIILTMANVGDDIKKALTGGSVAVVGEESTGLVHLKRELQDGIGSWIEQTILYENGYFNPNTGQIINDNPAGKRSRIPVTKGERYKYTGVTGVITVGACFLDENGNFLSKLFSEFTSETNIIEKEIIVPENAKTLLISNYAQNNTKLWKLTANFNQFAKREEIVKIPEHDQTIKTLYSVSELNYRDLLTWHIGDISEGNYQPSTRRIRTDVSKAPTDLIIKVPWYSIHVYLWIFDNEKRENGTFKLYTDDIIVPKDTWFSFVVRYSTEGTTVANVKNSALYTNFSVLPYESFKINSNLNVTAHRGYNRFAPENTIPALVWAKKIGINRVEVDIDFTSDGICVCIHDNTINRTSNGTGVVREMSFETIRSYDFGGWKHPKFVGTKIPTLEEVLACCKQIGLHLYIDMNAPGMTDLEIEKVVKLVKSYRMIPHTSFIGAKGLVEKVLRTLPKARIGFIYYANSNPMNAISEIAPFKTDENDIFMNVSYDTLSESLSNACLDYDLGLEAWTINFPSILENNYKWLDGYSTDGMLPSEVFKAKYY